MPYNGSGVFSLVAGNPVVTGTVISSTWANQTLADLSANGLSNALTKDGQTTPTANIPLGGFKLTGLAAATLAGDAVRYEQAGALALTQGAAASGPLGTSGITGAAASGANSDITSTSGIRQIQPVTASVAANALTISIAATSLDFRSTTLGTGVPDFLVVPALSIVVPNTATLGTANAIAARLMVLCINNAGTPELAVINQTGGFNLDETGLISTTALNTGSDSANVIYSTAARTNVAYRVVGFVDLTQASAGVWATAPSLVQGAGGRATVQSGFGQTTSTVTRTSGVTYYAPTASPVHGWIYAGGIAPIQINLSINGGTAFPITKITAGVNDAVGYYYIPAGASYVLTDVGSSLTRTVTELR